MFVEGYPNYHWQESETLKLISLYLPVIYIKLVDELVDLGFYPDELGEEEEEW